MRRTRPPTRVSNACDRCRRQKQRCDEDRPCSNCLHARAECRTSDQPVSNKKPRLSNPSELENSNHVLNKDPTHVQPVLNAIEAEGVSNVRYEASASPTQRSSRLNSVQRDSVPNERQDSRREQHVLAELRGSDSAVSLTKKILGSVRSPTAVSRETFAIPGGALNRNLDSTPVRGRLLLFFEVLGIDLPSRFICDTLLHTYFQTVHWFSLVVYEPKFRERYTTIMDRGSAMESDRPFLLLLLMIMIMGCWYSPGVLSPETLNTFDFNSLRREFLKIVCQNFIDLIDEDCLEFIQLSVLLGSYWLYWGRPRSAFSVLGAVTKSAQAMELHRNSDNRLSFQDAEERKRIWWTIYTWDRFSTTVYGRPLGINDKDCNTSMPGSFSEDINFSSNEDSTRICLSPYQIQLNRIYQITSPLLENIYGIRYSHDRSLRSQMPTMVTKIDQLMRAWQDDLPADLHLDKDDDIDLSSSTEEKMHRLQALSLQLTYDNLMIVIHRPLLADQGYRRSRNRPTFSSSISDANRNSTLHQENTDTNGFSFRQCLDSALRISKVQQSKRNLLALARSTHLVSFLGMNLFTSSVVLFICALSDTLSDIAQEAKRGMARNLKMLKLLSGDGSLSRQCSIILEDLVQQIVDKEKEEMLRALPTDDEIAAFLPTRRNSYIGDHSGSNQDDQSWEVNNHTNDISHQWPETVENEPPGNTGSAVYRAMASLQEVFKDVAIPRTQVNTNGQNMDRSHQQHFQHNQVPPDSLDGARNEHPGFIFDGSNLNTEDLGQFWLWNMTPYIDESSVSWASGDDFG